MKYILLALTLLTLSLAPTYAHCGNCGSDDTNHSSTTGKKCPKCGNVEGSAACKKACGKNHLGTPSS
jgi:Zn finger protein HypA/HybF involved in hydrogenase expression